MFLGLSRSQNAVAKTRCKRLSMTCRSNVLEDGAGSSIPGDGVRVGPGCRLITGMWWGTLDRLRQDADGLRK